MSRLLYAGVDGGQSGSRAVLADGEGHVLAMGVGPACDHITSPHGYERNAAAIQGAILDALTKSGADASEIIAVGMGLTSAPRELDVQPIFARIVHEIAQPRHVWVDHDAATNLAGATAGAPGVMVIAGSGSIAYGINAAGEEGRAGGLGYLMGDEGSGWWIGISALKAAAAAADGRGEETAILPYVLDHYDVPTIRHMHGILYGDSFRRPMVSGITADIARLAQTDEVAHAIMTEAGERLGRMVLAAVRQIHRVGDVVDIYPTGGVFRAGEIVVAPFRSTILAGWPEARLQQPHFEPVFGALIRGYQAADVQISGELITNLKAGAVSVS